MRNRYLEKLNNNVIIKITGKNINRYLKRIMKQKINILKLKQVSTSEIHLTLSFSDYQKLKDQKSIYQLSILSYQGNLQIKKKINQNKFLLLFLLLGLLLIIFLSNMIFKVEVIHSDKKIRQLLTEELKNYNIQKFTLKKSYQELEKIEDEILEKNKDRLEWIEIIEYGTKYTVRVEERKIEETPTIYPHQTITAAKNAIIKEIDATSGEKVKEVNEYVKKGDEIISAYITKPDNTKIFKTAQGTVIGEVWYQIKIDYPFVYQESTLTGQTKQIYVLHFLNKRLSFFNFSHYHTFDKKDKVLLKSNLLNISLNKETQYETIVKDEVYTEEIVQVKAFDYIKRKLMNDNKKIKEVTDIKILSKTTDHDSVEYSLFVKTNEDITQIKEVTEPNEEIITPNTQE